MAVDLKKNVSMTIREEVSFCGRRQLENIARRVSENKLCPCRS